MINNFLAFGMPGGFELIILLVMGLFAVVIPIAIITLVITLVVKSNKKSQN